MNIQQRLIQLEQRQKAGRADLTNYVVTAYADDYKAEDYSTEQLVILLDPIYRDVKPSFRTVNQ